VTELNKKAFIGLLRLTVIMAAALFIPAWTLNYWQGWVFLAVFAGAAQATTIYLMKYDPKLLERRMKAGAAAEKERSQKIIQTLAFIVFIAVIVIPAFDHRLGWSRTPAVVSVAGDILVATGWIVVFLVFRENSYASSTIEVGTEQKLVSTGPYAVVRHPMYIGGLVMILGVPLALGSWWGLFTFIPFTAMIVWRLLDEERFLARNLPGYPEYRSKVRYRLVPLVW
jgi:protein-S-isoprenylcysteine O-methyltransferase Ste14